MTFPSSRNPAKRTPAVTITSQTCPDSEDENAFLRAMFNKQNCQNNMFDSFFDNDHEKFEDTGNTESKVNEKLAQFVNKRFDTKIVFSKLKVNAEKYPTPRNCDHVWVSRVNPSIWDNMGKYPKGADIRLTNVQKLIVEANAAIIESI
ncbi:hypothetical protein SNE40_005193 [Patella caerulea]|uniref:Uncharacterized protein n=1 Tax=Patella caerulea TaxID=87958 RepID=A0AAN8QB18_PATCE